MPYCKSCGKKIMWVKTEEGRNMPIDYDPELEHLFADGHPVEFDYDSMVSHFATCPEADKWRKNKKGGEDEEGSLF